MAMTKCPNCQTEIAKPDKTWKYSQFAVNAYLCPNCKTKFRDYSKQGKAFELSIPTPEHYLPLLYVLALQDNKDEIKIFNDKPVAGSLTMTSIKIAK